MRTSVVKYGTFKLAILRNVLSLSAELEYCMWHSLPDLSMYFLHGYFWHLKPFQYNITSFILITVNISCSFLAYQHPEYTECLFHRSGQNNSVFSIKVCCYAICGFACCSTIMELKILRYFEIMRHLMFVAL